jgi:hypothetical protein
MPSERLWWPLAVVVVKDFLHYTLQHSGSQSRGHQLLRILYRRISENFSSRHLGE